jgi:hypothetical protein
MLPFSKQGRDLREDDIAVLEGSCRKSAYFENLAVFGMK